jgi:hypothetical protein
LTYQYLERILDKTWLRNNPDHTYNKWVTKPTNSRERMFLSSLDNYLEKVTLGLSNPKTIQDKLRNWKSSQFRDTYNELKVGCFIRDSGFDVDFEWTLNSSEAGKTPDIFVKGENVIIEVKTLHRSLEVEKGINSRKCFDFNEAVRLKRELFRELEKYGTKEINYPLAVIVCPDFINQPLVSSEDVRTVLFCRGDKGRFNGAFQKTDDVEYRGLYFEKDPEKKRCLRVLSGVGLWRQVFYENLNADRALKIPQGRLLDLLNPEHPP